MLHRRKHFEQYEVIKMLVRGNRKQWAMCQIVKAFVIMMIIVSLCGCFWGQGGTEEESDMSATEQVVLTQRQMEILEEGNLSTDYEELSYTQKKAILAIEEGLVYLEEKYGIAFSYCGYVTEQTLEKEHLSAYPTQGIKEYDACTVWFDRSGDTTTYEDDYLQVALRDAFNLYIFEKAQEVFGAKNVEIYTNLYSTSLDVEQVMTGALSASDYNGNVLSRNLIFVDGNNVSEAEFDAFNDAFVLWMQSENLYPNNHFIYMKMDNFEYLTALNYNDYLGSEYYVKREQITVETDGTIE